MSGTITEHNLFKPRPSKAESKADITNHTARAIIGAEAERREAKTARLREARLEKEATRAAEPSSPKRRLAAAPRTFDIAQDDAKDLRSSISTEAQRSALELSGRRIRASDRTTFSQSQG